jgi:hypothetical protein
MTDWYDRLSKFFQELFIQADGPMLLQRTENSNNFHKNLQKETDMQKNIKTLSDMIKNDFDSNIQKYIDWRNATFAGENL